MCAQGSKLLLDVYCLSRFQISQEIKQFYEHFALLWTSLIFTQKVLNQFNHLSIFAIKTMLRTHQDKAYHFYENFVHKGFLDYVFVKNILAYYPFLSIHKGGSAVLGNSTQWEILSD